MHLLFGWGTINKLILKLSLNKVLIVRVEARHLNITMWKEHNIKRFINIFFLIIGSMLIFQEIYDYLHLAPTSLEKTSTFISMQHMPEIILCPEPSFRISELQEMGFKGKSFKLN